MKKIKVLLPIERSFKDMDKFISEGGEAFSVSRYGYEILKDDPDIELQTLESKNSDFFVKLLRPFLKHEANNLISQLKIIFLSRKYDVIYYSADRHPYLICMAKLIGLIRTPVLMLCHFSFNTKYVKSPFKNTILKIERILVFKTIEKIIFLGEQLMLQAKADYKVPDKHLNNSYWGASISYFSTQSKSELVIPNNFYFSSGNAMRDYKTLIDAFRKLPYNLVISCPKSVIKENSPIPSNITHYDFQANGLNAFSDIKKLNQNAKAVLVPILEANHNPNGASSFVEALACGKPILISDTGNNFLDVEDEKVGKKIKLKDVNDWVNKITYLESNPKKIKKMSANSLELANIYNYERFVKIVKCNLYNIKNG